MEYSFELPKTAYIPFDPNMIQIDTPVWVIDHREIREMTVESITVDKQGIHYRCIDSNTDQIQCFSLADLWTRFFLSLEEIQEYQQTKR